MKNTRTLLTVTYCNGEIATNVFRTFGTAWDLAKGDIKCSVVTSVDVTLVTDIDTYKAHTIRLTK